MAVQAVASSEAGATHPNEPDGFEAFAGDLHPRLVQAVELYCGDLGVAEDAAQEALAVALERWERVKAAASPDAYVMRIAMNSANAWYRRLRTRRRHGSAEAKSNSVRDDDQAEVLALRAALAQLPQRQRQAVVLRYFGDFSVEETAASMKCAEGTVRALTSQAVSGLRQRLGAEWEEPTNAT